MKVNIHLHGILRDKLPPETKGRAAIDLKNGTTVADLLDHLDLNRRVVVAVNEEEESDHAQILRDGDKVTVFTIIGGG